MFSKDTFNETFQIISMDIFRYSCGDAHITAPLGFALELNQYSIDMLVNSMTSMMKLINFHLEIFITYHM